MNEMKVEQYQDEIDERTSEDYSPYNYVYEVERDLEVEDYDTEHFVWTVNK